MGHFADSLAARCRAVLMISQGLFYEAVLVWLCGREVRVVEVCLALQMFGSAGAEAAATIVLRGALCEGV